MEILDKYLLRKEKTLAKKFEIDENLNISDTTVDIGIFAEIEMSYTVVTTSGDNVNVNITVVSDMEIDKVITPNGNEEKPESNNKQLTFNYDVSSKNDYVFKIKIAGSEKLMEYKLKIDSANAPKITQLDSNSYPILAQSGVVVGKRIKITYGTNTNNYYSLDNGTTWKEYVGTIIVKSNCTIMAKSVNENTINQVVKSNITLSLASDAIGAKAYNGTTSDYFSLGCGTSRKMLVDSSMWGKNMYLSALENAITQKDCYKCFVYAYLNNGSKKTIYQTTRQNDNYTRKAILIPQNTSYIIFHCGEYSTIYWNIREIQAK